MNWPCRSIVFALFYHLKCTIPYLEMWPLTHDLALNRLHNGIDEAEPCAGVFVNILSPGTKVTRQVLTV